MYNCTLPLSLPKNFYRSALWICCQNTRFFTPLNKPFSTPRTRSAHFEPSQAKLETTRHEALTLQHKAEKLLESVFNAGESSSKSPASVDFWRDVLSDTFENLSLAADRPARVMVYGLGEWSGAEDLVTALLDEPLSSDPTQENILCTRWNDADPATGLTLSSRSGDASSSICLSSSYLSQFSFPLEITELRSVSSSTQPPPSSFFKADVPIIVFNPLITPLSSLQRLSIPSHTIFVASSSPNLNNTFLQQSIQTDLLPNVKAKNGSPERLLVIDSSRALSAIQSLRSNPTSALAVQQYQDNFTASGISLLTKAIRSIIDSGANAPSPGAYLRNRTALIQLHDTLSVFHSNVREIQQCLDDIREDVSRLTSKIEEIKVRVPNDILSLPQSPDGGIVSESLKLASKEMKGVLERLSWWKTIWRVDEISGIVGGSVERVWCKDLERKLILQTGRLYTVQQDITNSAMNLVRLHPQVLPLPTTHTRSPSRPFLFTTHVLQNTLFQLTSSQSYTLTPSTLTKPIIQRKLQLLQYPTTRMHLKAQRLILGMSTGMFTSSGFTWAGWMGYLSQGTVDGVWGVVGMGMDPMTGMGVGLLGLAGSVRWAVGRWEKEKRRWWADWERIGKGLERDLKATVDKTIQDQVVLVAQTACNGLKELCDKQQGEKDRVKDQVVGLQTEVEDIYSRAQRA